LVWTLPHFITSGFLVSRRKLRVFLIFVLGWVLDPKFMDLVFFYYGARKNNLNPFIERLLEELLGDFGGSFGDSSLRRESSDHACNL
jgi:hypothetical protein